MEYRKIKENDYCYNHKVGDTLYTIVVKSNKTANKNILDIAKQILQNDVEELFAEKYNELAECSCKENKL